jgi:hypothetical protein
MSSNNSDSIVTPLSKSRLCHILALARIQFWSSHTCEIMKYNTSGDRRSFQSNKSIHKHINLFWLRSFSISGPVAHLKHSGGRSSSHWFHNQTIITQSGRFMAWSLRNQPNKKGKLCQNRKKNLKVQAQVRAIAPLNWDSNHQVRTSVPLRLQTTWKVWLIVPLFQEWAESSVLVYVIGTSFVLSKCGELLKISELPLTSECIAVGLRS